LLVEDDGMVRQLTTTMLTALGYTVLAAETPAAALALADEVTARIDLLATDIVMPEMNGRELSEKITARRPDIRTLFMSGYSTNAVTLNALLDRGTTLLQKPFSRIDLARKVREALARE
jgi:CheY-like chemotaxis protein